MYIFLAKINFLGSAEQKAFELTAVVTNSNYDLALVMVKAEMGKFGLYGKYNIDITCIGMAGAPLIEVHSFCIVYVERTASTAKPDEAVRSPIAPTFDTVQKIMEDFKESKIPLNTHISSALVKIPTRVKNALINGNNINTVDQLIKLSIVDLSKCLHIGEQSITLIRKFLSDNNLSLSKGE